MGRHCLGDSPDGAEGRTRRLRSALLGRSRGGSDHPSAFARLCAEAGIDGAFLRAFPDRKDTRRVLSALRRKKIPVVLLCINEEGPIGGTGFDVVTLRREGRVPSLLAVQLGSVACHVLLQRLAKPRNPPADLVLE